MLSVTAVSKGAGWNFVTTFPAGTRMPDTSSLNMSPADGAVANLVTIKLGNGAVDLNSYVDSDLIVDLIGVYRADVGSGRLGAARCVSVSGACPRHPFWRPARRGFDLSCEPQRVGAR